MERGSNTFAAVEKEVRVCAADRGLELVELKMFYQGHLPVVRCIVDYAQGGVTLEECSGLNRILISRLTELDLFGDDFSLEVNSPGLDRPLTDYKDFARAKGKTLLLWFKAPFQEKTYMEAVLDNVGQNGIRVSSCDRFYEIPYEVIKTAKQKIKP